MKHVILSLVILAGLFGIAFADGSAVTIPPFQGSGVLAEGAPVPPVVIVLPDPVEHPIDAGSTVYQLYKSGGLVPALVVGIFLVLTFLSKKVKWLQEGHRAVYVAAALAGLAIIVEPASRGTSPTWGMLVSALASVAALAFNPKQPEVQAAKAAA